MSKKSHSTDGPVLPGGPSKALLASLGAPGDAAAVFVPLLSLRGWQDNPRKYSDEHVADIAAAMNLLGWGAPILARSPEDPEVIAGHVRMLAGALIGAPVAPVRWMIHLSEEEAHALALADNKLAESAKWDKPLLRQILPTLRKLGIEPGALGFRQEETKKLLSSAPMITIAELEVSRLQDEFYISVRGPMPAQADAIDLVRRQLAALPGCTVEVGMVKR